jgi:hypothetical protein
MFSDLWEAVLKFLMFVAFSRQFVKGRGGVGIVGGARVVVFVREGVRAVTV